MKIQTKTAAWACALLVVSVFAGAEGPHKKGDRERHEIRFEKLQKELGLTDEQATKLKEHRQTHRKQEEKLREQLMDKRKALHEELKKPELDMGKVNALHAEVKALDNQSADHRLGAILEVRKILGPEQFKKFKEKMHERREKMGKGQGRRGPDGDRPGKKGGKHHEEHEEGEGD